MIETATGLVLRTRPLTETSLIVHWLTRESGRMATVAKGARRPKSPFRGKLDLFYLADLSLTRSRRSDLHTLREASLRDTHPHLRQQLALLRQTCYCVALLEQATESDTPIPETFDLLLTFIRALAVGPARAQTLFAFELKFLAHLGLNPNLDRSRLTAGAKEIAAALGRDDWPAIARLQAAPAQCSELRMFLHGFITFHLGRVPSGRAAAAGAS